jgi:hypothetical protein
MVQTLQHTRHTTAYCECAAVVTAATRGGAIDTHKPRSVSQSLHKADTMCASDVATAHAHVYSQSLRVARCRHMTAASVCECDTTRRRQRWGHVTPRRDTHHATATRDTAPRHTTTRCSTQSHPAAHREQGQCTPQRQSGCTPHTPAYHSLQRCDAITATATPHGSRVTHRTRTQHTRRRHTHSCPRAHRRAHSSLTLAAVDTHVPHHDMCVPRQRRAQRAHTRWHARYSRSTAAIHSSRHGVATTTHTHQRCVHYLDACGCAAGPETPSLPPPRHVQHTQTHDRDTDTVPIAHHASQRHVA